MCCAESLCELTARSRILPEKLVKKLPVFYGIGMFVTAFTKARQLSVSWFRSIQSVPSHPTSLKSTLILSSHLCLGLQSGLLYGPSQTAGGGGVEVGLWELRNVWVCECVTPNYEPAHQFSWNFVRTLRHWKPRRIRIFRVFKQKQQQQYGEKPELARCKRY